LFYRIVGKLSTWKFLVSLSVLVLILGLILLLYPIIDGWGEIFFPGGQDRFLITLLLHAAIIIVVILHIICFTVALFRSWSIKVLIYMVLPIGLLIGIGVTQTQRRIESFKLGAQTRVIWAGGPSKVRQEAIALLATTSDLSPPPPQWPPSLQALGAVYIELDKNAQVVDVKIPPQRFMYMVGDQFGYLIMDPEAKAPISTDHYEEDGKRIWKIADGIYLYEIW
jgi:hypothetical protein